MNHLLQILLFLFTCFTSNATFSTPQVVEPTRTPIFQKTETITHSEKAKIGLEIPKVFGIARSSIDKLQKQNSSFHQNTFSLSTYLKAENFCALDFQKTSIRNQFTVVQFSKKEQLSLVVHHSDVRGEYVNSEDWATSIDILGGMTTIAAGAGDLATAAQRLSQLKQFSL